MRQSSAYAALSSANYDLIRQSVGLKIADILDRPNIIMLQKLVDPLAIEVFLASEIQKLTELVNVDQRLNIQNEQIPMIAAHLIELFPTETLEDFILCFKRGATGYYGSIFRLDAAVLIEWMRGTEDRGVRKGGYLDEKYTFIESQVQKEQQKAKEENKIDYAAFIARRNKELNQPPPRPSNEDENEFQRYKLARKRKTELQVLLHRVSSEYYEKFGKAGLAVQVWYEEQDGFEILAETEAEAEEIFKQAEAIYLKTNPK